MKGRAFPSVSKLGKLSNPFGNAAAVKGGGQEEPYNGHTAMRSEDVDSFEKSGYGVASCHFEDSSDGSYVG